MKNIIKTSWLFGSVLLLSFTLAVGPEAMTFPSDIRALALSGAGAAGGCSIDVNPATIIDLSHVAGIEFTHHRWYSNITGINIRYSHFGKIPMVFELTNWESGDIGQWSNVPQDEPIGTISLHWVSAGVTTGLVKNSWRAGLRIKSHFGRMVTESVKGFTVDAGLQKPLIKNLTAGITVKNLGVFSSGELNITPPVSYAAGVRFAEPFTGLNLMADVVQEKVHGIYLRTGLEKSFGNIILLSGAVLAADKKQVSFGVEYGVGAWSFGYGIAFHENTILGTPQTVTVNKTF